jgi:hypothetical protein
MIRWLFPLFILAPANIAVAQTPTPVLVFDRICSAHFNGDTDMAMAAGAALGLVASDLTPESTPVGTFAEHSQNIKGLQLWGSEYRVLLWSGSWTPKEDLWAGSNSVCRIDVKGSMPEADLKSIMESRTRGWNEQADVPYGPGGWYTSYEDGPVSVSDGLFTGTHDGTPDGTDARDGDAFVYAYRYRAYLQ